MSNTMHTKLKELMQKKKFQLVHPVQGAPNEASSKPSQLSTSTS